MFGARPLSRLVQTEVRNPLTDEILFGQLEHGGTVRIGIAGEKLAFAYSPSPPPAAGDAGERTDREGLGSPSHFGSRPLKPSHARMQRWPRSTGAQYMTGQPPAMQAIPRFAHSSIASGDTLPAPKERWSQTRRTPRSRPAGRSSPTRRDAWPPRRRGARPERSQGRGSTGCPPPPRRSGSPGTPRSPSAELAEDRIRGALPAARHAGDCDAPAGQKRRHPLGSPRQRKLARRAGAGNRQVIRRRQRPGRPSAAAC